MLEAALWVAGGINGAALGFTYIKFAGFRGRLTNRGVSHGRLTGGLSLCKSAEHVRSTSDWVGLPGPETLPRLKKCCCRCDVMSPRGGWAI